MIRQPEVTGGTWFNVRHPITPEELNGRVVLIDFWTYSCVNCLNTLPYLKKIWEAYKHLNFFIIGIHTPEFEFEKDPKNVADNLAKLAVTWPVVLDNDYVNWNNFANHYWPAKYLFDQNGYLIYDHHGEGNFFKTDQNIREAFKKDFNIILPPLFKPEDEAMGKYCFIPTPEIYCGNMRGNIANEGGFHEDHLAKYFYDESLQMNQMALVGDFISKPEYIESFSEGSTIYIHFNASEINLVLERVDDNSIVEILLDGKRMPGEMVGQDVDQTDVIISEPRMYNLLKSKDAENGTLSISAKGGNFRAYAFTFSGCINGK